VSAVWNSEPGASSGLIQHLLTRRNAPRNADFTIKCSKNQQDGAATGEKTMVTDPRDAIWAEAYQLRYQVHYALEIEHQLLSR